MRGGVFQLAQNDEFRLEAGSILLDQGNERTLRHLSLG
jgi:hypothetical protein